MNDLEWTRFYPMKSKAEAHESASLLFQSEGVPNVMIMDGAPEQAKGIERRAFTSRRRNLTPSGPTDPKALLEKLKEQRDERG